MFERRDRHLSRLVDRRLTKTYLKAFHTILNINWTLSWLCKDDCDWWTGSVVFCKDGCDWWTGLSVFCGSFTRDTFCLVVSVGCFKCYCRPCLSINMCYLCMFKCWFNIIIIIIFMASWHEDIRKKEMKITNCNSLAGYYYCYYYYYYYYYYSNIYSPSWQ